MSDTPGVLARAAAYLADAARGIRQAPVEVVATLCVAVTFSWALEVGDLAFQSWAETTVACVLLLAVAWTGTLLHALGTWSATRRWVFTIGGAMVVALYATAVQDFDRAAEHWRAGLLVGAAVLWLVALPAFGGTASAAVERMRRVDGRILLRLIGALLYGGALFAGLALALRAIDVLFELELRGEIYGHVWAWIFFVLVPWIVLGGLPDYVRPIEQTNAVAGVAHRIILYLVPPLLALYYLILFAYVIRIGVTGEIPKNLVSPMVLAAGALAALALLLFDPQPGGRGLARWLRLAPPLFLPLAPLGAWALLIRIDEYGWTEFRVIRLAVLGGLAALAIGATVQLVRRRPFALHVATPALAVILLLGAVGPWSALALSRHSQQERLTTALESVDVPLQDTTYGGPPTYGLPATPLAPRPAPGTLTPSQDTPAESVDSARIVPAAAYEQIRGTAQYLASHFGSEALPPVLRRFARSDDMRWQDYAAALGLRPDSPVGPGQLGMGASLAENAPVELQGGTAYRIQWTPSYREPGMQRPAAGSSGALVTLQDSTRVALHIGTRVLYAELGPLVASLRPRAGPSRMQDELPADQAVVPVTDTAGVQHGQLVVWHLWAESDSTGLKIARIEGLVVVRPE